MLYIDGFLGSEKYRIAIDRGAKVDARFADLAALGQAEHLESAGISENRPVPMHEPVQPAVQAHHFDAGPQHQMKGVAQDDLAAGLAQFLGRHRLDGAVGAHRHEHRRLHAAARKGQAPSAGVSVSGQ